MSITKYNHIPTLLLRDSNSEEEEVALTQSAFCTNWVRIKLQEKGDTQEELTEAERAVIAFTEVVEWVVDGLADLVQEEPEAHARLSLLASLVDRRFDQISEDSLVARVQRLESILAKIANCAAPVKNASEDVAWMATLAYMGLHDLCRTTTDMDPEVDVVLKELVDRTIDEANKSS